MEGLIFDIKHFSVHDGPGIRATVFFKGCPLRCAWCHNPESWLAWPQSYQRRQKLGDRIRLMPQVVGNELTADEVMRSIEPDIPFFEESGGGVTFSGGEPLMQAQFLLALLELCESQGIHTAVDTSGFAPQPVLARIAPRTKLFLYDLKLADCQLHQIHTGVSNKLIISNLEYLNGIKQRIFVRVPLIPGITDVEANLRAIRSLVSRLDSVERVDLLPFHNIAKSKYQRFGIDSGFRHDAAYSQARAQKIRDYFEGCCPTVSIGG